MTKTCSYCKKVLTLPHFAVDRKAKYGRCCKCKNCAKEYRLKNKTRIAKSSKEWRSKNKEKHQSDVRFVNYKKQGLQLTKEEYFFIYEKQKGECAICGKTSSSGKKLCLDHCHKTLKIRGFLCPDCNIGLGKFKDDHNILHKAIVYLLKNK